MQQVTDEYLIFALACLAIMLVLMRLLLRERITLQGSMSFIAFLFVLGLMAVFPNQTSWLAHELGFTLMSNFFFCTAIAALAILHLRSLVTLSKVQLRSIVLTQELALMQEKLDRVLATKTSSHAADA
jgi:hypothetical protein